MKTMCVVAAVLTGLESAASGSGEKGQSCVDLTTVDCCPMLSSWFCEDGSICTPRVIFWDMAYPQVVESESGWLVGTNFTSGLALCWVIEKRCHPLGGCYAYQEINKSCATLIPPYPPNCE